MINLLGPIPKAFNDQIKDEKLKKFINDCETKRVPIKFEEYFTNADE
jgi:hypothetical protein